MFYVGINAILSKEMLVKKKKKTQTNIKTVMKDSGCKVQGNKKTGKWYF